MATSPSMDTSNTRVKYAITVTENSYNVTNNTSNVTVSVSFWRTNTGYTTYGTGTVYCKINGVQYSASVTSSQKITDSGIVLFSKTLDVSHNTDGTKTLTTSAWINLNTPLTSSEQSYSQALTTIPRASQPSCITWPDTTSNVGDIGRTITIHMNRASSSFTHTVYWKWYNRPEQQTGGNVIARNVTNNCSFTIPMAFCDNIPNSASGWGTIYVDTYNGSTFIGTKTVTFTANVPNSVLPTISAVSLSEATAGLAEQFAAYVQNKSTLAVTITAAGAYSSTITSYKTTIQGAAYTGASFTSQVLTASGTSTVTVTVTDSRNRTATYTTSLTVLAYFAPKINSLGAYRINTSGTADDEGTRVAVSMDFAIAEVGTRNTRTYSLQYKQFGGASFSTIASGVASWTYSGTQTYTSSPVLSQDYAYVIRLTVTDYFGSVTQEVKVPTAFVIMDFRSTGKGVAFGKVSERDALEVAMDLHLTGDFVQEAVQTPTLQNSWVNYGAGYQGAGYWKDKCGVVHLCGLIKSGATAAETVIFTLPTGYRPAASEKFFAVSLNGICVIDIYASGNVSIKFGANSGWLSLSGLTFKT